MCVYLGENITDCHETSPGEYIHCTKPFYEKKSIFTNVTIRSVFQNPVTYETYVYMNKHVTNPWVFTKPGLWTGLWTHSFSFCELKENDLIVL